MKAVGWMLACAMLLLLPPAWRQVSREMGASQTAQQELLDLESHWLQVENDPSALESILAPDFLHVVPTGIITKNEQLSYMRRHPVHEQIAEKHFENLHVRVYGDVGIVNGVVVESGSARQETLFTDVFVCRDGKWEAVNAQELPAAGTRQ